MLYWGTYLVPKDAPIWKDIMKVARELADRKALLAAPDSPVKPEVDMRLFGFIPWTVSGAGSLALGTPPGVKALGKVVDGATWWLVVDELFIPFSYTLKGLDSLNGETYVEEATGQTATVSNGTLSFNIPRYGVHILKPKAK